MVTNKSFILQSQLVLPCNKRINLFFINLYIWQCFLFPCEKHSFWHFFSKRGYKYFDPRLVGTHASTVSINIEYVSVPFEFFEPTSAGFKITQTYTCPRHFLNDIGIQQSHSLFYSYMMTSKTELSYNCFWLIQNKNF